MIRIGFDTICNCQPDITYILLDIRLALHRGLTIFMTLIFRAM